jgi:site-specific DNA-cytosine methylase
MKVAVLCEYSGRVRDAFIKRGHDAISCDLLPTERPGPHIQDDIMFIDWNDYDLIIAHPPCTALAVSGNRWYAGSVERREAVAFVASIWEIPVKKMCIENPVGVINSKIDSMPKPQYIQPWMFGHGETKKTGLWLRGLPDLKPTNIVEGREQRIWKMPPSNDRAKLRSLTYQGIADAMAEQWG